MNKNQYHIGERIMKGAANHRRIQILQLLAQQPGLTLYEVRDGIGIANQTACEHIRRLCHSGLVQKKALGRYTLHNLSQLGRQVFIWLTRLTVENDPTTTEQKSDTKNPAIAGFHKVPHEP